MRFLSGAYHMPVDWLNGAQLSGLTAVVSADHSARARTLAAVPAGDGGFRVYAELPVRAPA